MTKEEKQRGLKLQSYIDSIRDMTIKEIAIKYLKKNHLPKFLASILVRFSTPLLLAKDCENAEFEQENIKLKNRNCELADQKASLERWLGEAKEIIKYLLKHTYGQNLNTQNDFDLYLGRIKDAEQFLKECEK